MNKNTIKNIILCITILIIFIFVKDISFARENIEFFSNKEFVEGEEEILENNISSDNSNLKVMRLDKEGISPDFENDIKEYYFIADNSVNSLDVTAIPENKDATVSITGNNNLKNGLNTINIEVISADNTEKTIYKIYVTKTNNIELANANLENLAVKQGLLFPVFDANITKYELDVSYDIEELNILAVPQKINAKVEIKGNSILKIGDNLIEIVVTAEDEITTKKYVIIAHRRSKEEEAKSQEEQKNEAQRLVAILENEEKDEVNVETHIQKNKKINIVTFILLGFVIIGFVIALICKKLT